MNQKRTLIILAAMLMVLGVSFARAEVLPPGGGSGAIFTTTPNGSIVNENVHYAGRQYVYLDGGPKQNAPAGAAGLDEGFYVFQITDPPGKLLLSRDPARCRVVHVNADGVIDQLMAPNDKSLADPDGHTVYDYTGAATDNWQDAGKYANEPCHVAGPDPDSAPGTYAPTPDISGAGRHDTNPDVDHNDVGAIVVQMMPYGLSPNPGGVYKAWMTPIQAYTSVKNADLDEVPNQLPHGCIDFCASADPGFVPSLRYTKTDNFKVTEQFPTEIRVQKFEDRNDDGIWQRDSEPEIGVGKCVNASGEFIACPGGWPYDFTEPLESGTKTDTFYTPGIHVAGIPGTYTAEEHHLPGWVQTAAYLDGVFVYDNGNPAKAVSVVDQKIAPGVVHVIVFGNYKLPEIEVIKTADDNLVPETGQNVIFTFTVKNTGTVPVTITSLSDSVFGDLAGDSNCQVGTFLAVGASCEFSLTKFISGDASGPDHVNVFTAKAEDEHGNQTSDDDDETVSFEEVLPAITVEKTANPTSVIEKGDVTFTFKVTNTGPVPVTITSLSDSVYGILSGDADCQVGTSLAVGASCEFSIIREVSGVGDHVNVFTAKAKDKDGKEATDDDDAKVEVRKLQKIFLPVVLNNFPSMPTIQVTKTANPTLVFEPGGDVTFTFKVENTGPVPVTITSLSDSVFGTLAGDADCQVGTTLAVGAFCEFSMTKFISGNVDTPHVNVFTTKAEDDRKNETSDEDDERVEFFKSVCALAQFGLTIGYEDLPVTAANDYDYNDWIVDVLGNLDVTPTCDLEKIDLTILPQAHGAEYDHTFRLLFPADTFASNGTATLTIYDKNGNIISNTQTPFMASVPNDFTLFNKTSDVLPARSNVDQSKPQLDPAMTAKLSIAFGTPAPFTLDFEDLISPRGVGLFFNPQLYVINTGETVNRGDFRLLVVPVATYLWPEESVAIFNVYDGVDFISHGNLAFQPEWWLSPHNDCVYDDKPCPLLP